MSDGTIEVLGQKLSYPTNWQGVAAVTVVCVAFTVIAYIAKGWATPEVLQGLSGLASTTKEQESINKNLLSNIEQLSAKIVALEKAAAGAQISSTPAAAKESEDAVARRALEQQLSISKLREQLADQRLTRLQKVTPIVQPEQDIQRQVQQVQNIQQQQQLIQQQIQQKIQEEQ